MMIKTLVALHVQAKNKPISCSKNYFWLVRSKFFMFLSGTKCESSIFNMASRGEPTSLRECVQSYVDI